MVSHKRSNQHNVCQINNCLLLGVHRLMNEHKIRSGFPLQREMLAQKENKLVGGCTPIIS
jgi:hypothetical protein